MTSLKTLSALLVLLVFTTTISAHARGGDYNSPEDVKQSLAGLDYLPAVLDLDHDPVRDASLFALWFLLEYDPEYKGQEFTEAESRFFECYLTGIEYPVSFDNTVRDVLDYYEETGRIPADGLDLLTHVSSERIFNPEKFSEIKDWTGTHAAAILRKYPSVFCVINPASGKYIDSFQQQDWTPLGICITELEEIPKHYYLDTIEQDGRVRKTESVTVLQVKLYGENEGEVIYDSPVCIAGTKLVDAPSV